MVNQEQAIKNLFAPASNRPNYHDKSAIVHTAGGKDRAVTYGELEGMIAAAAAELGECGVNKGDRVILSAENSAELLASIIACWSRGAISVPVDLRITPNELGNVVKMLGAKVLVGSSNVVPNFFDSIKSAVPEGTKILDVTKMRWTTGADHGPVDSSIDLDAPLFVILTSGTTGMPKGAVHTMRTLVINMIELAEMARINDQKRGVLPLPLSHIFGLEVSLIALAYGMLVVFTELSPTGFVQSVAKHKPHVIAGVPILYGALMAAPKEALDLSAAEILLSGGSPLPISLAEEFNAKFGKRINNGYGATESKIVALNLDGPFESVGTIVPSVKIEIVDENDKPLPEGETGEIRIAGPILMQGYLGQPEVTQKVLHDGHYHTGDMGYFKDGYLFIAGRSKEMIIVAGYKVFPVEVEDALRKHPLVKEVAVLGHSHSKLGQIVKAVIVVNDGELSDKLSNDADKKEARQSLIAQLKDYCKDNLRRELRPMEWEFQPASQPLPKLASGKIDKKKLVMAPV